MELFGMISVRNYVVVSMVVGLLTVIHYRYKYTYFSRLGINGPTPLPILGTSYLLYWKGHMRRDRELIKDYGKLVGLYEGGYPTLLTTDEDILREVMVKQFHNFMNRQLFLPVDDELVGNMLILLKDGDWKRVRSTLTPTFTSGKLKQMSKSISDCAEVFIENLGQFADDDEEFEVKEASGAFALDVIARTGFGVVVNSQKDKDDEFLVNAKKAMNFGMSNPLFIVSVFFPKLAPLAKKLGASFIAPEAVQFFASIVEQAMSGRKTGDRSHQDFVQLMVNAHKDEFDASEVAKEVAEGGDVFEKTKHTKALSKIEILSQGFVFFTAGYNTTSNALTLLLYCLVMHPECQRKAQEEVDRIMGGKKEISYEDVNAMTYLNQCFNESTRLFPPAPRLTRMVSNDVTIKGIPFKKGHVVGVSVLGRHMDLEIWPEPEKFDPERFSPEEKARHGPFDHMPFGYGPRNCIALRLAVMEVKLAAALVLKNFNLVATAKTKAPLRFKKMQMVAKDGIWMKLQRRAETVS